jgi:multidrug resistance efflux pump
MNTRKLIIFIIMLLLLVSCGREPATVESSTAPIPDETTVPSPSTSSARPGVTILADGVVQAVQPTLPLAFEFSGKLLEVHVQPGDQVEGGDVLARLEGAVPLDSYEAVVTSAELSVLRAQQALEALFTNASTMASQAQMNLAVAQEELQSAEYRWRVQQEGNRASGDTIAAAEANLVLAEQQVKHAQGEFNQYSGRPEGDPARALALSNLVAAKQQRDSILRGLNWYTGSPSDIAQAKLDAEVAIAQVQLENAEREWEARKNGPDADEVALAEGELANAQAQLKQAQHDLQKAIDGAVLVAPTDGTILSVEAVTGTLVGGGAPIFILLDTTQLAFHTTNLSERDVAQIFPGQTALITLKSYPNDPIEAAVVRIGWQASGVVGDAATFPVMLDLSGTELVIRPGMTGRVEIRSEE